MIRQASIQLLDNSVTTVTILPFDMICFERESKKPFASKDGEVYVESMFKLAYLATVREGKTTLTFDEWLRNVADVDMVDAPKVSTPTEPSNS
jgi:hypothetical protein